VRFQKGNSKPTPYQKKYGKEMMPFSEQVGRGDVSIMPMVSIEGRKD
jgi:glycine cleavage system aminomethyltransferase T